MKTLKWTILLAFMLAGTLHAQKLADLYAKPIVKLEAIAEYGNQNNWNDVFFDYTKTFYDRPVGKMKEIVTAPDGSVFMTDKTTYSISKFDKNGNFVKKIGKKGGKNSDFISDPNIAGILDNKYIVTTEYTQGRVQLFTLDGEFYKLIKMNISPNSAITLKNSHIAMTGWVGMGGNKGKTFVMIKNLETGKEKILWHKIDTKEASISLYFPNNGGAITYSLPYTHSSYTHPQIACSKAGNLLVAFPETGEVVEYSYNGVKLKSFKPNIKPLTFSQQEINQFFEDFKQCKNQFEKSLEKNPKLTAKERKGIMQQFDKQLNEKVNNKNIYSKTLPYFSSFMVDSDDNLLLFEFTKEENNQFKVYALDREGKYIATSQFSCDNYDLSFIPKKFTFHNGYIYAMGMQKTGGGNVPLRLVKFRLTN